MKALPTYPLAQTTIFAAQVPADKVDLIYLCSPNNPTGATMTKDQLIDWVNYAKANGSIILFDAAYESFITDDSINRIPSMKLKVLETAPLNFDLFSKECGLYWHPLRPNGGA